MPRRNKNASRSKQRTPSHQRDKIRTDAKKKKAKKKARRAASSSKRKRDPKEHGKSQRRGKRNSSQFVGKKFEGFLEKHDKGFGFLLAIDPEPPNVYLPEEELIDVLHRDKILVQVTESYGAEEKLRGKVLKVIEHSQKEILGTLRLYKGGSLLIPTDPRDRDLSYKCDPVEIEKLGLKNGAHVLAKIEKYPSRGPGLVSVKEELHPVNSPSVDTTRVLVESSWPRDFSSEAVADAKKASTGWKASLPKQTVDLRKLKFVTIDGADARDFDDAVYSEISASGKQKIWVAIADVSHFVCADTALDREAYERATSVYFPDHVVPMLPEVLSNGVCSLNPNEDRAALVCEFVLSKNGKIERYRFFEALIRSHMRMTYELMQNYIDGEDFAKDECAHVSDNLNALTQAFQRLFQAKVKRGALDLDLPEAQVVLHEDGNVLDIKTRVRTSSHRLIEELMLAANECAARFLQEHSNRRGMYRIHEEPDEDRAKDLVSLATMLGWPAPKSLENIRDYSDFVASLREGIDEDDPRALALQTMVLRSMQQARYSENPKGHFALANPNYTHFTSPIRRYPDLIVHRLIKEHLRIPSSPAPEDHEMEATARHCSDQERRAMDMEWRIIDLKKCRYMEKHLGEDFRAMVTSVIEKGVFCQIEEHFVDGLIPADLLHERAGLQFDAKTMSYRSKDGKQLRMGDRITIKVTRIDLSRAKIEFDLVKS